MEGFDESHLPQGSFKEEDSQSALEFAGFWRRVGAYIIDGIILGIAAYITSNVIGLLLRGSINQTQLTQAMLTQDPQAMVSAIAGPMMDLLIFSSLASFIIYWFYFAGFESSKFQATPGKSLLGIVVTDMDGDPVTFGTATGRFLGKILSALILYIGFLMVAWTKHKQGLHDMIAGTLVIRKPRY
jgi:uncharacterized RDD family membrane protein YckC